MSTQTTPFAPLLKEHYVSLTTFRKNGAAVAAPVWFVESNGTMYIGTAATAGNVKRIRNSGRVALAPCTAKSIGFSRGGAGKHCKRSRGDRANSSRISSQVRYT